jgi:hypothetical protein
MVSIRWSLIMFTYVGNGAAWRKYCGGWRCR